MATKLEKLKQAEFELKKRIREEEKREKSRKREAKAGVEKVVFAIIAKAALKDVSRCNELIFSLPEKDQAKVKEYIADYMKN